MFLSELTKIINALPPIDLSGGPLATIYVNMKNHPHLTAIIQSGVSAGAVSTVTVEKSATGVNGVAGTPITFRWRKCNTGYDAANGDLLAAIAAATGGVAGEALSTVDNSFAVIELEASELGPDYPYVRLCFSDAAASEIGACIFILSGSRYQEPPTALTV